MLEKGTFGDIERYNMLKGVNNLISQIELEKERRYICRSFSLFNEGMKKFESLTSEAVSGSTYRKGILEELILERKHNNEKVNKFKIELLNLYKINWVTKIELLKGRYDNALCDHILCFIHAKIKTMCKQLKKVSTDYNNIIIY